MDAFRIGSRSKREKNLSPGIKFSRKSRKHGYTAGRTGESSSARSRKRRNNIVCQSDVIGVAWTVVRATDTSSLPESDESVYNVSLLAVLDDLTSDECQTTPPRTEIGSTNGFSRVSNKVPVAGDNLILEGSNFPAEILQRRPRVPPALFDRAVLAILRPVDAFEATSS